MKKLFIVLISVILVFSCDAGDYASKNVVSVSDEGFFEELIFLIGLKEADSSFLVVESVDSVEIYINNQYWAKVNSEVFDTVGVHKEQTGNMFLTPQKINYLLLARQDIEEPDFTEAGDFANFLNATYILKPGEYACFIKSFQLRFNDGSIKKYSPYLYLPFKVEENSRSVFVGEIEFNIY